MTKCNMIIEYSNTIYVVRLKRNRHQRPNHKLMVTNFLFFPGFPPKAYKICFLIFLLFHVINRPRFICASLFFFSFLF